MKIRYLGWAGIEIDFEGHTLLIDYIQDTSSILSDVQFPSTLRQGKATAALVTHLHSDHADPVALSVALADGAPVFRPEVTPGSGDDLKWTAIAERQFRELKLNTVLTTSWEWQEVGPFKIMSGPSVDGLGDPQCCWIVKAGDKCIIHAGDTINHGYWWTLARNAGRIDIAFLPINGAVVELPHLQPPSPFNATMLPEEAAVAAHILGASTVVPIHHTELHRPGIYEETPNALERLSAKAAELGIAAHIVGRGEWICLD
ncbi:MBL fold metallo-hydrolase [Pantoea agglomerans]|uniref:MBL fold metallo-hydrolase n=1 Tax=Enterobacter agglomerans TaxID=549 RepID=UPI0012ADDE3C|nr:MBL fold metallo-hydrolase [Pantoea agglomerans]MRT10439.1 MBL fold metallo-hydrolase [Pantoea agglomerans]